MNDAFCGIIQYTILRIVKEKNAGFGKNKTSPYFNVLSINVLTINCS